MRTLTVSNVLDFQNIIPINAQPIRGIFVENAGVLRRRVRYDASPGKRVSGAERPRELPVRRVRPTLVKA